MSISMKRYNDTIITPKDDRILFDQIFDDYGLIYGGSATMAASNKIHVGAARGFIKGTEVIVEAEDIAVNLSDSGTKNGRLKIVMDLADTETPIKFESEVAASFPALEQDANINYDNGRYEVVFATYKATETTISSVALVMPTMQSVKAKIQGINQSLTQSARVFMNENYGKNVSVLATKCDDRYIVSGIIQITNTTIGQDIFEINDNNKFITLKSRSDVMFINISTSKIYLAVGLPGGSGIEANTTAIPSGTYMIYGVIQ